MEDNAMSQYCPIYKRIVVYLTCLECETKECKETSSVPFDNQSKQNQNHTADNNYRKPKSNR